VIAKKHEFDKNRVFACPRALNLHGTEYTENRIDQLLVYSRQELLDLRWRGMPTPGRHGLRFIHGTGLLVAA